MINIKDIIQKDISNVNINDLLIVDQKSNEKTKAMPLIKIIDKINGAVVEEIRKKYLMIQKIYRTYNGQYYLLARKLFYNPLVNINELFLDNTNKNNGFLKQSEDDNDYYDANQEGNYKLIYNYLLKLYNDGKSQLYSNFECALKTESYNDYQWILDTTNHTFRTPLLGGDEFSIFDKNGQINWFKINLPIQYNVEITLPCAGRFVLYWNSYYQWGVPGQPSSTAYPTGVTKISTTDEENYFNATRIQTVVDSNQSIPYSPYNGYNYGSHNCGTIDVPRGMSIILSQEGRDNWTQPNPKLQPVYMGYIKFTLPKNVYAGYCFIDLLI